MLISVGTNQLISLLADFDDELFPPHAASVATDNNVTAPRPTRFKDLISIMDPPTI